MVQASPDLLIRHRLQKVLFAGAVSALLAGLPALVPVFPVALLSQLAALPLLVYGLRFGWQAVAMAGVSGWGTLAVLGALAGTGRSDLLFDAGVLVYLGTTILPALAIVAALQRGIPARGIMTVLAGLGSLAAVLLSVLVPDLGTGWQQAVTAWIREAGSPELQQAFLPEKLATMALYLPGFAGIAWMVTLVGNYALAGHLIRKSGLGIVQPPRFRDLSVPGGVVVAGALGLMLAGSVGGAAVALANAGIVCLGAVFISGLALVHGWAGQLRQPGLALGAFYFLAMLLGVPFLLVLLAGAADAFFHFRRTVTRN